MNNSENITNQNKVFVILVNYNGSEDTIECVESLLSNDFKSFEIIIIDNNSEEQQKKILKDKLVDSVKIIYLDNNIGFAGGNNVGIKCALEQNADYILLLNNDTIVESDFLTILLNSIINDNTIGICTPKINFYSDRNRIWSAGGKINNIRGSAFSKYENIKDDGDIKNRYVDFASGCCLLIKKEVIEKVGVLDENYFLYLEDTDFCLRVVEAGFKILFVADSKIYHKVSNSTSKGKSSLPIYYNTRNRLFFTRKYNPKTFFITILYIYAAMLLKSLLWIFTGKFENISAMKKAYIDFFKGRMGKTHFDDSTSYSDNHRDI